MHFLCVYMPAVLLAFWTWIGLAHAQRQEPANLQVDLLFPRDNETYAPTQWFPLVFSIQNLDAFWPNDAFHLYVMINKSPEDPDNVTWKDFGVGTSDTLNMKTDGLAPSQMFFHTPLTSITNETNSEFIIWWRFGFFAHCQANQTANMTDENGLWTHARDYFENWQFRRVIFFTEPGAQLPDIEETITACAAPGRNTTGVVRITELKAVPEGVWGVTNCPVLDENVEPNTCAAKDFAKEVAANVSDAILGNMGCEGGEWQTIRAPCQKEEEDAADGRLGVSRALALSMAFFVVYIWR